MKEKVSKDHPILLSIMLGVILTVLVTFSSAISLILKFSNVKNNK